MRWRRLRPRVLLVRSVVVVPAGGKKKGKKAGAKKGAAKDKAPAN